MSQSPKPATEGRIVHVHTPGVVQCQPAIVVRAWGDGTGALNLQVFRDGSNDHEAPNFTPYGGGQPDVHWRTSVSYSEERVEGRQTWHWPEYVA